MKNTTFLFLYDIMKVLKRKLFYMIEDFREGVKEQIDNDIIIAKKDKPRLLSLIERIVDNAYCHLDFADIKTLLANNRKFSMLTVCDETFEKALEKIDLSRANAVFLLISSKNIPTDEQIALIESKCSAGTYIIFSVFETTENKTIIELASAEYTKKEWEQTKACKRWNADYIAQNERFKPFTRRFDKIARLKSEPIFARLKADIVKSEAEVFPAVRVGAIDFYYKGGLLYRYDDYFMRDKRYEKILYQHGIVTQDKYEKAKQQNKNKNTNKRGTITERQLLDKLNKHTFDPNRKTKIVVLDIEIRLPSKTNLSQKCDMVLLNTKTNEIMFVEGKVFKDKRVNVEIGRIPEVINQVKKYSETIKRQIINIEKQYGEHIRIINELFDTNYNPKVKLISSAKLLVYGTPKNPNANGKAVIEKINNELCENNVFWVYGDEEPSIDEIWNNLYRKTR
ncbi:MAG: hypothetical protein PHI36_07700 [Bacteroidales bacterium]|nr:hypothetical protein [Bacteroidales bacterium]